MSGCSHSDTGQGAGEAVEVRGDVEGRCYPAKVGALCVIQGKLYCDIRIS